MNVTSWRVRLAVMGRWLRPWGLAFMVMAPVAGDIGSCGQEALELDPAVFFWEKLGIDCARCLECELQTESCLQACEKPYDPNATFDPDCFPLVHDGEVCLNRLYSASCDEYAQYMNDAAPASPTECNFCPLDLKPESSE